MIILCFQFTYMYREKKPMLSLEGLYWLKEIFGYEHCFNLFINNGPSNLMYREI